MIIHINWKIVLATGTMFCLLYLLIFCYSLNSSPSSYFSPNSRRLMNEGICKGLEEQIDRMHSLIHTKDKVNSEVLDRLRTLNFHTRNKLEVQMDRLRDLEMRNRQLIEKMSGIDTSSKQSPISHRLAPQITPENLRLLNIHQKSEFDVLPYVTFSPDRLYQLESGMINKPEVAPIGIKKFECEDVIDKSVDVLNSDRKWNFYKRRDLFQGYYRIDRLSGTEYKLLFDSKDTQDGFEVVQFFRPFAPLQHVQVQSFGKQEWINLIVPLSGRVESFEQFLSMFTEQCIKTDKHVHLTVVYFEEEGRDKTRSLLEHAAKEYDYNSYTFIEREEQFSRGVGLLAGAEAWKGGDVLLFFCDVDIVFKQGFLDRCRLNSNARTRVYYPIVFSLYNPSIVYEQSEALPSWEDQLVLKRDTGFWRTFGFGMTCMYRSDFLFMRGFDTKIQGWGMEDVKLYQKFAQSNFNVMRAPDPGIFHMWHEKSCDSSLSKLQYDMCLKSKALNEASQEQLGLLAFRKLQKEAVESHREGGKGGEREEEEEEADR